MIRAEEQVIISVLTHRSQRVFRSRRRPNTSAYGTDLPVRLDLGLCHSCVRSNQN